MSVIRNLDKKPFLIVELPQSDVLELPAVGQADWEAQTPKLRAFCEEVISNVKAKIHKRRLYLDQFFKAMDKYEDIKNKC